MPDRGWRIIETVLATLREFGDSGFSQPRVAAGAGLRQSHLTFDCPTQVDLLAAVGRAAIDRLLAAVDAVLQGRSSDAVAPLATHLENTGVLMALALGVSVVTVEHGWRLARACLAGQHGEWDR